MKNIHLIPTDKPSRVWTDLDGNFYLHPIPTTLFFMQHIYITSSEEIKEGDWYYNHKTNTIQRRTEGTNNESYIEVKKIILTTDTKLINDGVQAIPDEFIEWFVKNANESGVPFDRCEVKKIQFNPVFEEDDLSYDEMTAYYSYKIIIPKEQIISSEEDAKIFVDAINNAPEPNEKLKKAFKNFKYIGECKGNQNGCFLDSCGHDCGCFTRVVKEEPKQYPIGGYSPGFYHCTCSTCKTKFQGDKRASQCEPCVIKMTQEEPKQETLENFPTELESVLAKISHQNDLGLSQWYEVVYYADDRWCSYSGSKTFQDGEKVVEWVYCKNQFKNR
jgi:hypothetical protein